MKTLVLLTTIVFLTVSCTKQTQTTSTMKARPELKQFDNLSREDFMRHPVWVSCHIADYDEEWYDDTDEETFRPWTGALPVGDDDFYLVRSSFILKDGTAMAGFATPATEENAWGTIQPQIFHPSGGTIGVWLGILAPHPNALTLFCESLGKKKEDVFPIRFSADDGLTKAICSGTIFGLMRMRKDSVEIIKK